MSELQFNFANFGPIGKGTVRLKPLTVITGDNQAGKSFAAMAIHALLRALPLAQQRWHYGIYGSSLFESYYAGAATARLRRGNERDYKVASSLHERMLAASPNEFVRVNKAELAELEAITSLGSFKSQIEAGLQDIFSTPISTLITHGRERGEIKVFGEDWWIDVPLSTTRGVTTSFDLANRAPVDLAYVDRRRKGAVPPKDGTTIRFRPSDQESHEAYKAFRYSLWTELDRLISYPEFSGAGYSFYIPAIRSGLLMSHRLFLSLLVRNVHRIGLEPLSIPQMTGVTAEFLQSLLLRPDEVSTPSGGADALADFERLITGGRVYFKPVQGEQVPALHYQAPSGLDIPLNLTSSTVQEVAPMFLLLRSLWRYVRRDPPWVIIEEPESHLSPPNQATMARFLATLVNRGFRLVITTHSSFLLEQINNILLSSRDRPKGEATLHADQVSAHRAELGRRGVSRLVPLTVNSEEGIDTSAFTEEYERLFEESFRLKST